MAGELNLPGLALPAYARSDLAYTDIFPLPAFSTVPFTNRLMVTVPGAFIYYAVSAYVDITTSAVAGARQLIWLVLGPDGTVVTQVPAAATHPAATRYVYQWGIGSGSAFGPVGSQLLAPLMPQVLTAGYQTGVQFNGKDPGDTGLATLVIVKIPTGPPLGAAGIAEPLALG